MRVGGVKNVGDKLKPLLEAYYGSLQMPWYHFWSGKQTR